MINEIINCDSYQRIRRIWDKESIRGEITLQDKVEYYIAKMKIRERDYGNQNSQAFNSFQETLRLKKLIRQEEI